MFGAADEVVGEDEAVDGVLPADEGFEADDLSGDEVDLGLEVEDELLIFDGGPELWGFEVEGGDRAGAALWEVLAELDHGFELGDSEGLVEMAYDGEAEGDGPLFGGLEDALVGAAHKDDSGVAAALAEDAEELDAVDVGHDEVEEDQGGVGGEVVEEGDGVGSGKAGDAHGLGGIGDDLAGVMFVVDDEEALHGGHSILSPPGNG